VTASAESRPATAPAPVILFVYARPEHTERTLDGLAANRLAAETDVHIFADAPRPGDEGRAAQVAKVIARPWPFRSVRVEHRERNLGLADNIVAGVGELLAAHESVIVLEDDIVTSPDFLTFMNDCLVRYRDERAVWHVNGWTYPVGHNDAGTAYFTPLMECWGWATWADRWRHFERRPEALVGRWDRRKRRAFNLGGAYDYWFDIMRNHWGVVRTWAVFWYATIFEHGGLCISPPCSLTANIGIDGSGENSGARDVFATSLACEKGPILFPERVAASEQETRRDVAYMMANRAPLARRLASRLKWRLKRLRRG
jgi:hypothetical protein